MDRETFDRILTEEGIDDAKLREDLWNTRLSGDIDEGNLRSAAKRFKQALPELRVKQALSSALDREYGRDK